jgi:hypothetical protein
MDELPQIRFGSAGLSAFVKNVYLAEVNKEHQKQDFLTLNTKQYHTFIDLDLKGAKP